MPCIKPMEDNHNDLAAKAAAPENAVGTAPVIARQDGERFEAVIVMEGMEETVNYEHTTANPSLAAVKGIANASCWPGTIPRNPNTILS